MFKFRLTFAACIAGALIAGCASHHQEDEAYCRAEKPGTITSVNRVCAIMPDHPVDPAVSNVEWKGRQVGFCCNGCKPAWAKLSESEKDAKVAAAVAKSGN